MRDQVVARPADSFGSLKVGGVDILDCRGKRCPIPVIELAKWSRSADSGAMVRVLADDPAAAVDIPAWCRMRGREFVKASEVDGVPAFDVRA